MVTAMSTEQKAPSTLGFWIGGTLLALGVVVGMLGLYTGVTGIADTVEGYQRVSLASGGPLRIEDPGTHNVFFETDGADEGYGTPPPFAIVDPAGDPVAIDADRSSSTYSVSGYSGRKLGTASFPGSGTYEVRIVRVDGGGGDPGTLAVGRGDPTGSVFAILGGVFGGGALVLLGIVALVITGVRRGRRRPAAFAYPGPHPGGPAPVGPYPGWPPPPSFPGGPAPGWSPPPTGPTGWSPPPSAPGGPAWQPAPPSPWPPAAAPPPPAGSPPLPPPLPDPPTAPDAASPPNGPIS